jgi:Restriction Endonuclease associating with ARP
VTKTQAPTFEKRARQHASDLKQRTPTVPDEARVPAPYIRDGNPVGCYPYCLPAPLSSYNLLPEVRVEALKRFAADHIAWQASIDGRPTNHLLSSQVQCVNALMPMSGNPRLVVAAFGEVLPIGEPLPIEDGRYLTFECIGAADHLGEAKPGIARERGRFCTSADAAIRYRRPGGGIEVALIEWKYTESYDGRPLAKSRSDRLDRYRPLFEDPDGPLRTDVIPYADLFVEPFYQLMRQQLLAQAMERSGELDADTVRVLHVAPATNTELQMSLTRDSHRAAGATIYAAWRAMLRRADRFVTLDSARLATAAITSQEYVARYAHS